MAFDPRTGHPKPLDDAYVAEELREWGQSPLGWETFVEDSGEDALWQRSGFRVLPEAGCAADEVAVAPFSWGVDLASCRVVASSHGILAADSPRRPSGECGQAVAQPFVAEGTQKKVSVFSWAAATAASEALSSCCGAACLPRELGGTRSNAPPYVWEELGDQAPT